ncbi:HPP family protein [Methylopila turkensis]|uniref:Membrane protein n=1 Tax=Methylopila turkensis TaxID=1437816 RepID=A0A9W6JJU5_9HYPH|nr:HPP family protein [Methylopila turkensis]GLK78990.1 membrane protein [Methylopila turkensis]
MHPLLRRFLPDMPRFTPRERALSAFGAFLGVGATGLVSTAAVGAGAALPAMIAPVGASAVLLFAVPASPLAQPWSIMGGNLVSAIMGVAAAQAIGSPPLAAAVAIGLAIAAMITLRCVHPPSGAVALTAVLGGAEIHDLGFGFVLWPVAANSALLLASALAFNPLAGRTYPSRPAEPKPKRGADEPAPSAHIGITPDDLDAALAGLGYPLDVGRADLEALLRRAQLHAFGRRATQTVCADVMARNVVAVSPGMSIREALKLARERRLKVLPVTDESARVIGVVTQTDFLEKATWSGLGPHVGLKRRIELTLTRLRAPSSRVEDIMTTQVRSVRPETPIADVVPLLSDNGLHHLPVVDDAGRLIGLLSQTDVILALLADKAAAAA